MSLVPALVDPAALEHVADPGAVMLALVEQARGLLEQAKGMEGLAMAMEIKSRAETIKVYTQQKRLGHDAELSAAEIVRRAERRIGQLIRDGQMSGEIAKRGDRGGSGAPGVSGGVPGVTRNEHLVRPAEAAGVKQNNQLTPLYEMADGVSDGDFDSALQDARSEGDLSRANVIRKVKGEPSPKANGERHEVHYRAPRINSNRVVDATVIALEEAVNGLDLVDFRALDPEQIEGWVSSLRKSRASLTKFLNQFPKETTTRDHEE